MTAPCRSLALALAGILALVAAAAAEDEGPGADQVRVLHDAVLSAVAAEDWSEADDRLEEMEQQLPEGHVTLLRARAWLHLKRGESEAARRDYREILRRLPGDEAAAVNLVHIHLDNEETEAAARVVREAMDSNPGSDRLIELANRLGV